MQFSDIHIHALYNCDDGAESLECMYKMIDAAYEDGTRHICLTPHYNPGYFGENTTKIKESYELLLKYTGEKYPELEIVLGNELRYNPGCEEWLSNGRCHCMNNSKYVLVDFFEGENRKNISNGLDKLLSVGYIPILAHAERYKDIRGNIEFLKELRDNGVLIQVDSRSVFGDFGFAAYMFCKKLLHNRIVDFVSSDAHDLKKRPPNIKQTYEYIQKRYGAEYAEIICLKNAHHIIFGY